MIEKESDFLKRLQATFLLEAEEHIHAISSGLVELETTEVQAQGPIVEVIFREAHSLKGAARAVERSDIELVCQSLETIFASWKRRDSFVEREHFDTLHRAVDSLVEILSPEDNAGAAPSELNHKTSQVLQDLRDLPQTPYNDNSTTSQSPLIGQSPPTGQSPPASPTRSIQQPGAPQIPIVPRVLRDLQPAAASEYARASQPAAAPEYPRASQPAAAPEYAQASQPVAASSHPSNSQIAAASGAAPAPDAAPGAAVVRPRPGLPDTVRIATSKLDHLYLQAEELLAVKLTVGQRTEDVKNLCEQFEHWEKEWERMAIALRALRAGAAAQHDLAAPPAESMGSAILELMEWNQERFRAVGSSLVALRRHVERDQRFAGGMVDLLLQEMRQVLMLPFSTLLEIFPKMVRDIARDQGKDVELSIEGSEVEIDRRILEEMKDPLIHLLRNSIDHGIEKPDDRGAKPRRARIVITILQQVGGSIEITIADDGRGIDADKVRSAAVNNGILTPEESERLNHAQALDLIYRSSLSTSPIITELSGRGLGMAIVREKVEKLGGQITVDSRLRAGTTFRIKLPLTLSTFRGILVEVSGQLFVVPTSNVERVLRIQKDYVRLVANTETIIYNGLTVPLIALHQVLELPPGQRHPHSDDRRTNTAVSGEAYNETDGTAALLLKAGDRQAAYKVDRVVNEQEVLVKSLGKFLTSVPNISGATVLGSGKLVPILNVHDLLHTPSGKQSPRQNAALPQAAATRRSILVAEDSITSRMLLKNILEAAGYAVTVSIDGVDALAALKTGSFDLVVSDVDMPRMNGFDLTSRIRADSRLSALPVVLVTARSSREDKERGIDVGANAYIVKSSFDQGNLMDAIERLL